MVFRGYLSRVYGVGFVTDSNKKRFKEI
jgi:hypothetical protein